MNLGVVFGPFIALVASQWLSYKVLYIGLAMIIIIGYLFVFSLKVLEYQPQSASTARRRRLSWHDFVEKKVIPIGTVSFLTAFAYASIMSFISVFAETKGVFEYVSLFFIVFARHDD